MQYATIPCQGKCITEVKQVPFSAICMTNYTGFSSSCGRRAW